MKIKSKPEAQAVKGGDPNSKSSTKVEEEIFHCSFCGKSMMEVRKLMAGPNVFICNECINILLECMEETNLVPAIMQKTLQSLDHISASINETIGKIREQLQHDITSTSEPKGPHRKRADLHNVLSPLITFVRNLPTGTARTIALTRLEEAILWSENAIDAEKKLTKEV